MDKLLKGQNLSPDVAGYDVVQHIKDLQSKADLSSKKAKARQLRNYNKHRKDVIFLPKDRVWVRNHPQSSKAKHFSAKLAPKWKGPYRVLWQLGPVNFEVVKEDTGEGLCNIHVNNIKACYPTAAEIDKQEKQKLYNIFREDSDEEDFLGLD